MAQSAVSRFGCRCIVGLTVFLASSALVRTALAIDDLLDEPTPLILKDGRIAQVSVHTIPFATGSGELDEEAAAELDALLVPLATDCFLTAQAIGHVEPGLNRDGDTLSAHRLARARADLVQAALAGHGMPLAAVASVWDWQFLVKDSRVTLWVFRLNVGDDCEGTPLPTDLPVAAAAAPVVAAVSPPPAATPPPVKSPPPAAKSTTAAAAGAATTDPRELSTVEEPSPPPPTTTAAAPAPLIEPPAPVVEPLAVMAEPQQPAPVEPPAPAVAAEPEPVVAAAAPPPVEPEPGVAAATPPAEPAATPAPGPVAGPAAGPAAGKQMPGPAIVFAVNSSFFSGSASRDLRAFVDQLPHDAEVEIELAAAVGTGDVRDADPDEAKRYNAWMAERRLQRVAEWLTSHAGPRQLKLQEHFVENDPSREVRLQARVLP